MVIKKTFACLAACIENIRHFVSLVAKGKGLSRMRGLREPVCRSDYRKSLPGQFIRIRLKIEQNCRLFWGIFSSAIMNDLFVTFTSRLKVDAKCVYQQ